MTAFVIWVIGFMAIYSYVEAESKKNDERLSGWQVIVLFIFWPFVIGDILSDYFPGKYDK